MSISKLACLRSVSVVSKFSHCSILLSCGRSPSLLPWHAYLRKTTIHQTCIVAQVRLNEVHLCFAMLLYESQVLEANPQRRT